MTFNLKESGRGFVQPDAANKNIGRRKMKNLAIVSLLLLANCSASGPAFNGSLENKTQIVVYRPDSYYDMTQPFWVEDNGKEFCSLHNDSYFVKTVDAGNHYLTSSRFMAVGTSKINVTVKPHETVYVKMEVNGGKAISGLLGGLLAGAFEEGVSSNAGPVYLGSVDKGTAHQEMMGLKQDCQ